MTVTDSFRLVSRQRKYTGRTTIRQTLVLDPDIRGSVGHSKVCVQIIVCLPNQFKCLNKNILCTLLGKYFNIDNC